MYDMVPQLIDRSDKRKEDGSDKNKLRGLLGLQLPYVRYPGTSAVGRYRGGVKHELEPAVFVAFHERLFFY